MNRSQISFAVISGIGMIACVIGAMQSPDAFFRAWLCSFLFWLGLPLAGVTLVLVHDLSGGAWMVVARPALNAAVATMPLASFAGIPAFIGLDRIYSWTHPTVDLGNVFYLNARDFFIRYGVYLIVWNFLAGYALFGGREGEKGISSGKSWISGVGLVALAFSASFASIDWILSLEPKFWSSIFPYTQASSWFITGFSVVVLLVVFAGRADSDRLRHMADLARIMLATTIFWAYVEFIQFLIIWEENLRSEIPWYLKRLHSDWLAAAYISMGLGFVVPFFVLLWGPTKRDRALVGGVCASVLVSRVANTWLLVLPEFDQPTLFWLVVGALLALGGALALLFEWSWRQASPDTSRRAALWMHRHG